MKIIMRTKMIIGTLAVVALIVVPLQAIAGFVDGTGGGGPERFFTISVSASQPGIAKMDLVVDGSTTALPLGALDVLITRLQLPNVGILRAASMELISAEYQVLNANTHLLMTFAEGVGVAIATSTDDRTRRITEHGPFEIIVRLTVDSASLAPGTFRVRVGEIQLTIFASEIDSGSAVTENF